VLFRSLDLERLAEEAAASAPERTFASARG